MPMRRFAFSLAPLAAVALILMPLTVVAAEQPAPVPEAQLEAGGVNPGYVEKPAWFKESFLDLREDVAEAAGENKRVLLYFYQDGCPYCKKLITENFAQKDIVDKTRNNFDVISVNMWGDREVTDLDGNETAEKPFATKMKVMFTPTLVFLDEQGNDVLRINGYYPPHKFTTALDFVSGKHEKVTSYRQYFAKASPAPAAGKLHQEPSFLQPPFKLSAKARNSGKPLLVLFEQKQCPPCDELHTDILQRPEAREQLERFDVALLDMWSRDLIQIPDGKFMSAEAWAKKLDVKWAPSLVFFNAAGEEVFRTDGYLKAFHIESVMDYAASEAFKEYPEFQRYIDARADKLEAGGRHIDLME